MKISDFIKELQEWAEKHGDVEVVAKEIYNYGCSCCGGYDVEYEPATLDAGSYNGKPAVVVET